MGIGTLNPDHDNQNDFGVFGDFCIFPMIVAAIL